MLKYTTPSRQIRVFMIISSLRSSLLVALGAIGLAANNCVGDVFAIPGGPQAVCTGLTLETSGVFTCGMFQDPRFDYVVIRERPLAALPIHNSLSIAAWFPSCVVPIVDATYIDDGGVVPTAIRIDNQFAAECDGDPESRFWNAQFTFDSPVTLGASTATLVLTLPKGALRGFGMLLLIANDPAPGPNAQYTTCIVELSNDGCPSDFNCDNELNLFDHLDFVEAFAATTDRADFNRDGTPDLFDYLDFVEAFGSGC